MERIVIRKKLEDFIPEKFVNFREYQDKFYLKKRIQEILPEKTDEIVYSAIEYANSCFAEPARRRNYIRTLLDKLL